MASHRPTNRESPAKSARIRLLLIAATALIAAALVSLVIAWTTGTGALGFGVAAVGLLVVGIGAVCLREIRRIGRMIRRVESDQRRAQRVTSAALDRFSRTGGDQRNTSAALRRLEKEVKAQGGLLQIVLATQTETTRVMAAGLHPEALRTQLATHLAQQQAMMNLFAVAPPRAVVPPMGGWAASADVVALLVHELLRVRPRLVVECGSGVSTLWLALAIEHHELDCRIVSLDHDPRFAEQTRRSLRSHGVDRHAEIRDAPLTLTDLDGHATAWYDRPALDGLADIGLLFVDGPPETTGPLVRYPAVPLLKESLAPLAVVVLDDVVRASEQEVAARWRIQLPDFDYELVRLQKHAGVFRREAPSPIRG